MTFILDKLIVTSISREKSPQENIVFIKAGETHYSRFLQTALRSRLELRTEQTEKSLGAVQSRCIRYESFEAGK